MKIPSYYLTNFRTLFLFSNQIKLLTSDLKQLSLARSMSESLKAVPKVDIDPSGVFKYILIKVHGKEQNNQEPSITIVRGYQRCNYHSDIYDEVQEKLQPLDCEPLGGGRISHEPDNKKIHIYGYSQGYGKADHEEAAKLIKDAYPSYTITISDEGY
ncbi:14 kDa phosphohistidine phosphatase-like isoform X2 [Leguminivora glycinivorella]|uniref:14 kDa phosphohistidine phosphatase-like isoform X2 n=1 Tax=Leguminivora glycinivorella TaxID=1035111 RepID=UPI00200D86A1|nr:14 kDa phosphohistidine phosphatase-like isoform X2 [Leguminivora glycinivorella]